jgi:nitrite reductase/ring-hydroxylating ferredoxin subunit
MSGLGALAAGVLGGVGLDSALSRQATPQYDEALVGPNGHWAHAADTSELPEGSVRPFAAGAVTGFLVHRGGKIFALSGVCTHMGCLLWYSKPDDGFVCPCHGAEFSVEGSLRSYPKHTNVKLPPLPWIDVRVRDDAIEVWTI